MAENNETRIFKSSSIEELRQKTNEVSLGLGDKKLLASDIADKTFTHTAAAGDYLVSPATTRFEYKKEETIDNTAGYILLTGSPTVGAGFAAGAAVTQSGGYSATIVSASTTKILVKNSSGTFSSSSTLTAGAHTIAGSAIRALVAESYSKAEVRVKVGATEYTQDTTSTTGFHVPNHAGSITITGISNAADVSDFEEGAVAYQGSNLAGASWSGTILSCSTTLLRTKTSTGTFSASTQIKVDGGSDTIGGSNHGAITNEDQTYGRLIEFNTPLASGNAVQIISTNLVDAINEVQDDVGTIGSLASGISDRSDLVTAANSLKTEIGTAALQTAASTLRGAINEHESDIGSVGSLSTSASTLVTAINEHDTELGTITAGAMGTSASTVSTAIAELHTDVDARLMLTKGTSQTINGDISFTNAKTFTFPSGSTLDIRQGSLLTGSGGGELTFDTAFLTLTANDSSTAVNQFGLEGRRVGSGKDVRIQFNETQVSGNKEARAWQLQGLDDSNASNTADIVTFYNAKELVSSNTESGVAVTWDASAQNFDFDVNDPVITFTSGNFRTSGNFGQATITNLGNTTFALTADTLDLGDNEKIMLGASDDLQIYHDASDSYIVDSGTGNLNIASNSFYLRNAANNETMLRADENSFVKLYHDNSEKFSTTSTGASITGTLTTGGVTATGTVSAEQLTSTDDLTVADDASIGGDLTVTGNLTVSGTQTILNTSTIEVEDTLVLAGNALTSEPATGGFGIEAGPIITQTVDGAVSSSTSVTLDSGTGVIVGQGVYGTGVASGATVAGISGTSLTLSAASSIADGATLSFSHPTKASNVTGSHSVVYNYGTDRWEADGSLILSEATLGTADVAAEGSANIDLSATRRLHFNAGAGTSTSAALNSNDIDITVNNTDRGSAQLIFKNVASDSGTAVADSNNDTLTITGGNDLSTSVSGDTVTIQHDASGVSAGTYGSQHTVPQVTVDARGHVTSVANQTAISLASLGYTGVTNADKYTSFNITGDSGSANAITSGETLDIEGGTNVTTTVSANKVTIASTDTTYSVQDGGLSQKNFTTALKTKLDGISTSANDYAFVVGDHGNTQETIDNGEVLRFKQTGAATITRTGANEFTIGATNTTYSNSSWTVTSLSGYSSNNGTFLRRDGTFATPTNTTYSVGDGGLTTKNFTTALYNKLNGIASGATANTGTVTSVATGNGLSGGSITSSGTLTMSGSYSGTFAVTGAITATGDITASVSDSRLKDRGANISNALEKVSSLSGFNYKLNDTALELMPDMDKDEEYVGVSAQEVEKVLPEVVKPSPVDNDYKTVQYEKLVPLLIEAIKELNAEIQELKKHK